MDHVVYQGSYSKFSSSVATATGRKAHVLCLDSAAPVVVSAA